MKIRRHLVTGFLTAALIIGLAVMTFAGNTATQVITIRVEEIAVMDVSGTLSQTLRLTSPKNGDAAPVEDSNTYIRYTSIVPKGKTRTITAAIASGTLPGGCALKLETIDLSGNGDCGNVVPGGVYLSGSPQSIITGIGSCYTGTGSTAGAQLAYALIVDDTGSLVPGETRTITISFTLTDAS